jgi:glycosyltransferase involved in cell wall biosynthesis
MSSFSAPESPAVKNRPSVSARDAYRKSQSGEQDSASVEVARDPITVLIVVPALDGGAADAGALDLVRILTQAGHRAIVASRAGRLVADVTAAGGEFVALDVGSNNPIVILRNAGVLNRIARERQCGAIHAFGRAGAWSAYFAARLSGVPFVTSWYKGFREQNILKHLYNSVMARGDRVIAVSDGIAQLINDRYATPWQRIAVVPCGIDFARFDPRNVAGERITAVRRGWGVAQDTKVILVTGRILRRKGHHVVVRAVSRLKEMGLKNFLCVFAGEDRGRSHYTGELWDLVLATGTMDVIRMAAPVNDMPAAYAAACIVVSGAVQPEGVQRAIVEAQAMARPVIVSDLAAGPDVVLTAPAVPENRATGIRFDAGDDAALAAALLRLFSLEEPARNAIGLRGRDWVLDQFNIAGVAAQTLQVYEELAGRDLGPALVPKDLPKSPNKSGHRSHKISAI